MLPPTQAQLSPEAVMRKCLAASPKTTSRHSANLQISVYHVSKGTPIAFVQTLTGLSNTAAYHLTFYTWTGLNGNPCSLQVILGSNVLLNVALSDSRGGGSSGYDKRDVDVHPTAYSEQLRIRLTCPGSSTANMFLDNVSFYAV